MQDKMKVERLSEAVLQLLQEKDCTVYMLLSSGECFLLGEVYAPDDKRLLYGLPKEYSRLGTALVDAIWFDHPVKLILCCGQTLYWSEAAVYKCHIAGPLFAAQLQRVRRRDSRGDIASSWEIHTAAWQQADTIAFQKERQAALSELDGSVMEEKHLDLQLR